MESEADNRFVDRVVDLDTKGTELVRKLNELAGEINDTAREKGWWDKSRSALDCLALVHAEISEAVEACRTNPDAPCDKPIPVTALEEELADAVIRIFDFAEQNHLNIGLAIVTKAEYNKTREYRHGGKLF